MVRNLSIAVLASLVAACGPQQAPSPRASVPGVDPLSGALSTIEAELPAADLANVRGPAGTVLLGASLESARVVGGASPDCQMVRGAGNIQQPTSARCASLLGAYATLERARGFLLAAGAESLAPALVVAEPRFDAHAESAAEGEFGPGLHYVARLDLFTLLSGPTGARIPAGLNPGAVTREVSRRQLRALAELHPEEAEGLALFLGAAASGDPGYLAGSQALGDPRGELDLSRPLLADASSAAIVAGALWAWSDASGDPLGAARAALAASRALASGREHDSPLLSLVVEQLNGSERDQACAVFRAHAGRLPACP